MKTLSRRTFIGGAVTASTGLSLGLSPVAGAERAAAAPATTAKKARSVAEWPMWDNREEKALLDVLRSGKWGRGNGTRVKEFELAYAEKMRAKHCVATASGTSALLTTLGALGVGPGDEVIMPPYTFVATFNVITLNYALPVFVDTDPVTFQIDASKIAAAITPATKLLLPVHIGGYPANLDAIEAVAKARKLPFVEDGCQAWLAEFKGQPIGSRGIGGCFSFQASKNLTSGEGGAVLTNDDNFAELCYNFHTPTGTKGTALNTGRASNYRMTEFQAALLMAQMTRIDAQFKTRDENAAYLTSMLQKVPGIAPARFSPGATRSAYHLYMMRYDPKQFAGLPRAKFLQELSKEGVAASGGYSPLNSSAHAKGLAANPHYQKIYGKQAMARWLERNQCPVNDRLCAEAIWFSQYVLLRPRSEMEKIVAAFTKIQRRSGELARV
ncbi:MAG: DegT/DnrJ/EryC1/StrS family aminotransferase [Opitutaceae bacterium]|nr:DegT/DnrJ/EryC1/StrS family aminotransferase [Opitutaceae bacterium]